MRKLCLTPVIVAGGVRLAGAFGQPALPAGALIEARAAGAIATGRRRNVEPIGIAPSEPALVA
jgi:hypothetical protein